MARALLSMTCIGLSAGLIGCASLFDRDPRSGYYDGGGSEAYERPPDLYEQKRLGVETEAREELGLQGRPMSDPERMAVEGRVRLKRLEARLANRREKKQYYGLRSSLANDRERIYFLSLPTFEARERWAANRGLGGGNAGDERPEEVAKTIESNDIALGMNPKAVLESWGDPDAVETAGNPLYGYERWKYNRYVSSGGEGYQKELRIVYFEGGRVTGWEREK